MADKPKRQLTEEHLKKLADARVKAMEALRKKKELTQARKQEAKEAFDKEYEQKVLKKKQAPKQASPPPVEETDKEIYQAPPSKEESDDDEDYPIQMVPKAPRKTKTSSPPPPQEPNFKQMYYKHKLDALQAQQNQQTFLQQYSQLPSYNHAVDIAKSQIKERVDKSVYENVYRQLFQC